MYTAFTFTGNNSEAIHFDIGETPYGSGYSIKELTFEYNQAVTRRPKMEKVGSWPGFNYVRECLIHVTFDILSTSAADMNAKKVALTHAILPDPTVQQTVETLGSLSINMDGVGTVTCDVGIDGDITIPFQFPNYAENCSITFTNAAGVFFNGGSYVYIK